MPHAAEIASESLVCIDADAPLSEAIQLLVDHDLSGAPVLRDGKMVGMVSELELFDVLFDPGLRAVPVAKVMDAEVPSVDESESLANVAHAFAWRGVRLLPVTRQGKLVSVLSR